MSQSPAERHSRPVDGVDVLGALSPSRAGDFMTCPLLYRYRTIDRFPEDPSPAAIRGTLVHKVLEDLFDLPAPERTPASAQAMVNPAWEELVAEAPDAAALFAEPEGTDSDSFSTWLASCRTVLDRYFELEDPTRLEPAERELYVETLLDSKLLLRGFIDRVDVAPDGAIRVVDYKGLAVETPLPTPYGWTTMGEVQVGDELIGSDGRATLVTSKSQEHHRPCFRVSFLDGTSVVCDNVHLWAVVHSHRQRQTRVTVTTDDLSEVHAEGVRNGRPRSLWVEAAEALVLPETRLPIDPWLLGAWLGDGHTQRGSLTIGAQDLADMLTQVKARWAGDVHVTGGSSAFTVHMTKSADHCTYGHSEFLPPTEGHPTRRCAYEGEHPLLTANKLAFQSRLVRAGLRGNKHIPADYLRAGKGQRIDLLRGLMDTDGWWNETRRRAGFTTTNDRLASDVLELLRSLGVGTLHFQKPYTNAVRPDRTWHIIEFTPVGFNPFGLSRKALHAESDVTHLQRDLARRRIITSVEPVDTVATQCVAVDAANALYLCGPGFIPTHNTGRSPGEMFEAKALFQMKFYALVIWRTRGVIPAMLQLIYLGNGEILRYSPDEADLRATERKVEAVWRAIRNAELSGDWRPHKSKLCGWCSFQDKCPEFGGEIPPLPVFQIPSPVDDPAGDVDSPG